MAQLTNKSKDYEKFTRELQIALEKEVVRQQSADNSEHDFKALSTRPIEQKEQNKTEVVTGCQKLVDDVLEMKKPKTKSIFRKIDVFINPTLLSKTVACKHDHGCFENVMRRALRNFLIGFSIQMLLKNIANIVKPAKLVKRLLKGNGVRESAIFGLFVMCFHSIYKLVLCLLRRMGSLDDRKNAPVAGFISAFSLIIDVKSRRQLLTVLTLSRALDSAL